VFVGTKYPDGINNLTKQEADKAASCNNGDVIGLMVSKYLRQYKYPEIIGCSYLPEVMIWNPLNKRYRTWYTNEVMHTYYVGEGGNLTDKKKKRRQYAPGCYYAKWQIMHPEEYPVSIKTLIQYAAFYFISHKEYRKNNRYLADLQQNRWMLVCLVPIIYPLSMMYRIVKGIR
jgi:hypothetical protein